MFRIVDIIIKLLFLMALAFFAGVAIFAAKYSGASPAFLATSNIYALKFIDQITTDEYLNSPKLPSIKNSGRIRPIIYACKKGYVSSVRYLYNKNFRLDTTFESEGRIYQSCLKIAVSNSDYPLVKELLNGKYEISDNIIKDTLKYIRFRLETKKYADCTKDDLDILKIFLRVIPPSEPLVNGTCDVLAKELLTYSKGL